jgi:uncharacterized protein (TIGR00251 family)
MRIEVKAIARASREEVQRISERSYRIKVTAPPEKGRANERIIKLLSKELDIKKQHIKIISGQASTRKIIEIDI